MKKIKCVIDLEFENDIAEKDVKLILCRLRKNVHHGIYPYSTWEDEDPILVDYHAITSEGNIIKE